MLPREAQLPALLSGLLQEAGPFHHIKSFQNLAIPSLVFQDLLEWLGVIHVLRPARI